MTRIRIVLLCLAALAGLNTHQSASAEQVGEVQIARISWSNPSMGPVPASGKQLPLQVGIAGGTMEVTWADLLKQRSAKQIVYTFRVELENRAESVADLYALEYTVQTREGVVKGGGRFSLPAVEPFGGLAYSSPPTVLGFEVEEQDLVSVKVEPIRPQVEGGASSRACQSTSGTHVENSKMVGLGCFVWCLRCLAELGGGCSGGSTSSCDCSGPIQSCGYICI